MRTLSFEIIRGNIVHTRFQPFRRTFSNKYYFLSIELTPDREHQSLWPLLGIDRRALFTVKSSHHHGDPEKMLFDNAINFAVSRGLNRDVTVKLLTVPAFLGFVFNPVSFYFAYKDNRISWVLVEVHNYNGGRRVYTVIPEIIAGSNATHAPDSQSEDLTGDNELSNHKVLYSGKSRKDFYVSPFFQVTGSYDFLFSSDSADTAISIKYKDNEERLLLSATFSGKNYPGTSKHFLGTVLKNPLLVFSIPFFTLYQAFRLWRSRLPFYSVDSNSTKKES